jgi:prepilin-type N-terminal cleavage/methylation domain-containing protein
MSITKNNQRGFTVIELLIATAIFSVILLVCATAMIQIARTYQKGLIASRTQEVARTATDEISRAIQFVGVQVVPNANLLPPGGGSTARGFCLDGKLYSYVLGKRKVESVTNPGTQSRFVLVVNDAANCVPGVTQVQAVDVGTPTGRELMGLNMRLATDPAPVVSTASDRLFKIRMNVVFGEDDLLDDIYLADGSPGSDGFLDHCLTVKYGGQFCAVSSLNTVVEKRVK